MQHKKHLSTIFPLLLVLLEITMYLSMDAYLPALPAAMKDLNTTQQLTQLTLTMWFLGSASVQLILAPLSNRYGRRIVLLIGAFIFLLTCVICSLTHNIYLLLIMRYIQGAMIPTMIIPGFATIHDLFDTKQAIQTTGWMMSITVSAPIIGPFAGSLVLTFSNWRMIFILLSILTLIAMIGLFHKMPETASKKKEEFKLAQIFLHYKNICKNKLFFLYNATSLSLFAIAICWITTGPFLLMKSFGLSAMQYGLLQGLSFCPLFFAGLLLKIFMHYFTPKRLMMIGSVFAACGTLIVPIGTMIWSHNYWVFIIAMMIIALGMSVCFSTANRLAVESSAEPMDIRVATSSLLLSLTSVIASGCASLIANDVWHYFPVVLIIFAIISLTTGFIAVTLAK